MLSGRRARAETEGARRAGCPQRAVDGRREAGGELRAEWAGRPGPRAHWTSTRERQRGEEEAFEQRRLGQATFRRRC